MPGNDQTHRAAPNLNDPRWRTDEWKRRYVFSNPAKPSVDIICCPEDVRPGHGCKHSSSELCPKCWIPLCSECYSVLQRTTDTVIPMGLANGNWWGYTTDILWRYQVRWIELAIASPCFTTMMVLYVEGDHGHLLNEITGKQQNRTVVKGSATTF